MSILTLPEGTVIAETGTAMLLYQYPYRKSKDVIMALDGQDWHCLVDGCDAPDFKPGMLGLINHVRKHDRRKTVQRQQIQGPEVGP